VDEEAGQELERIDDGLVVELGTGFGLVEKEAGILVIAKAGEIHRGPHDVSGELAQTLRSRNVMRTSRPSC
jgi:hypothetical protein